MNDAQILDRLAAEDAYAPDTEMPSTAWRPEVAFADVERRVATERFVALRPPVGLRAGWLVAAGAFAAVLLLGVVLLLVSRSGSRTEPVATTAAPPPTTQVPSTSQAPATTEAAAAPVSTEVQTLLASLERGYNRGDAEAVAALLAADAVVSLAPWVSPEVSPSSVSLVDRVAAAGTYDERIAFGECLAFDVEIRCDVTFEDEFSDLLRMDPWVQSWVIEVDEGLVRRIDVSGENADRAAAMEGFHEFVDGRPVTGVPPLLAGDLEWNRTVEGAEVYDGFVVFYAAVVGGVPEDAYRLVSDFYDALDRGDTAAAEALFAPGGQYLPTEADDATSAAVYADATAIGSPELTEYFTFWYGMLQTEWHPLDCSGTATEVTCFSESRGLTTLFLPGGVARGSVQFTLSPEGIVAVVDRTVRTGGSCGPAGCGTDAFDIRGFWRAWMHNEPEIETLWPGGNGDPPGGFTAELAQAIIEFYPRFLAENGINVPPEYFDGSPLQGP